MATTENTIMEKKRSNWKNLIQDWLKSNFSIAEYCNQNNLSQSTFQYWRAKFDANNKGGKKDDMIETPKFVPVEIAMEPSKDKESYDSLLVQYPNGNIDTLQYFEVKCTIDSYHAAIWVLKNYGLMIFFLF